VDKLEKRRLIAWRRSTADRRKVLIRMKSAGRRLIESLSPAMLELVRSVVEPLGRESTEFMRAKMRKILASAALDLTYADHPLAPTRRPAADPRTRESQWPPTWGLAGWLRCCQWSHHVDRIYRSKFRNLGLTAPRLQVLAVLAGAVEGMTADAVASASGLHQERLTSSLSALERAGLITKSGHRAQPGAGLLRLTTRGEQKMLAALPKANSLADDLYQGLSNEDLERVLSLIPKGCSAASQVRQQYDAARGLTSAASAQ
jgi:DNA-binding MarR family transcriptional regulator